MAKRKKLALHWKILIGLLAGVVVGLLVNTMWTGSTWDAMGVGDPGAFLRSKATYQESTAVGGLNADATFVADAARQVRLGTVFAGQLFLRGLMFIAVPIVLFSLVMGVSSLNDTSRLGRIGGKTIGIYLVTTALAITIGLVAANLIGPGRGFSDEQREMLAAAEAGSAAERVGQAQQQRGRTTWDVVLEIVPSNPFASMASGNTLQVVVAALLLGVAITMLPREKGRPLVVFFESMTEAVIKIVEMILVIAPYAVFALIVVVVADLGVGVLQQLLKYAGVVVLGLVIMMFVVYPAVLRVFTDVGYRRFFRAISPAQLLAFSSSSSGATLPVTMECCDERLGVKEEIGSFVLPIGATINMDGTALYQGVAAVFIAQMYGMDLTLGDQLQIVLTATLASIGTAAVPGVGIVMLVIVLESVGIPLEGIAVILGIDRILDMCRTSCNVTGDCMVAAVVAHSEGAMRSEEEVERLAAARAAKGLDEFPKEEEAKLDALR